MSAARSRSCKCARRCCRRMSAWTSTWRLVRVSPSGGTNATNRKVKLKRPGKLGRISEKQTRLYTPPPAAFPGDRDAPLGGVAGRDRRGPPPPLPEHHGD